MIVPKVAALVSNNQKYERALSLMGSALQLLDEADAPADVGAHLDLALCRLRDCMAQGQFDHSAANDATGNQVFQRN